MKHAHCPPRLVPLLVWSLTLSATASVSLFSAENANVATYEIGQIPDQRVWYSELAQVRFSVIAPGGATSATLTGTFNPGDGIAGLRTFDAASGLFQYTPTPDDSEAFTVTFSATAGSSSSSQAVTITPLRPLPSETSVFGLLPTQPLPLEDSPDFIDVTSSITTFPGKIWFNAVERTSLRDVTIVGKTVVFEEGHANDLWNFHDNDDLRSVSVHAEVVIFRNALHLPQTNVAIYATEVRFEDQEGMPAASLSTEPRASGEQPAQFANGRNGHNAGSLTLIVDAVTSAGEATRFILKGGTGEKAGPGKAGSAGTNRSTISSISGTKFPGIKKTWSWSDSNTIYAHFDVPDGKNTSAGNWNWPGNGGNATAGGKPGMAGDGGTLTSNVDLSAWLDNSGGREGTRAAYQSGGRGGNPRPAYRRYFNWDKQTDIKTHYSSSGAGAYGPASAKVSGNSGEIIMVAGDLRWLDPLAMQKVLIHLKRAYLSQHFDYVRENAADYIDLIELAMASSGWEALSVDAQQSLFQILDELRSIRYSVDSNLDYFGNPAGWVPMLSFEVNKLAFDNEIPRALRVMYLNYWLGNKAQTIQDNIDAMTSLRTELRDQVEADRSAYDQAVSEIPGLKFQARRVQENIDQTKTDIESLKNDLLPKAKNIALLKKTARALAAVAEVVPVGQPYVGAAGKVIAELPNLDPDKPWYENAAIIGTNVAGDTAESGLDDATLAIKARLGALDSEDIDEAKEDKIAELRALQDPLMDLMGESLNQMRGTQQPSPEVEAELQRLLADEPAYKVMKKRLTDLNREKQEFAVKLAQTMQTVVRLSLAITRNLLTIDRLNRAIQEDSLALSPETKSYLADMNERARDRLLKYHYFVARAYEYRMLQSYEGDLDLNSIFDKFEELATAGNSPELTADQFDSLRAVYEDQLSSITFSILNQYNSNRPTLSAPVRLTLSQDLLDAINAGESATLNLASEGIFLPSQENLRIVDLQVLDMDVTYSGSKDDIFYGDIIFQHSGESTLQREGGSYLFRHYNEETRSKIEWSTRFDPFDETLDAVQPSAADQSLLKALLSTNANTPSTEDLLLYSRPAANADLTITKDISSRDNASFTITRMRIELVYDFSRLSDTIKTLKIVSDEASPQVRVKVNEIDRNGRDTGEGDFLRSYDVGSLVTLEAPESVGQYRFVRWEGTGANAPESAVTTVSMASSAELRPVYHSILPRTLQITGGASSSSNGSAYSDGDEVPITATVPEGHRFVRWDGTGVADPYSPTTYVTISGDTSVTAVFEALRVVSAWLGNISSRSQVGAGSDIVIPGFVIDGTAPKKILVRAVGPTLTAFGVTGVLEDPLLEILQDGTPIASNDDWEQSDDVEALTAAFAATGAFDLQPGSKDAAAIVTLQPGAYTAKVFGKLNTSGVAIVEIYDAEPENTNANLINISARAQVGVGNEILIPGFVVDGDSAKQYLIRAVGPTLENYGVTGVLTNPILTVADAAGESIAGNDDWGDATNASDIATTTEVAGAFPLDPGGADAAVLLSLEPGAYTIQVSGVGNTTGIALVEIYEVR